MALTYALAPNPKWYFADLTGRPLGGGSVSTFRSLNKTQKKAIFQDIAGNFPWPNPTPIDENGTQGPLYFRVDSDNPEETYYVEVYDSAGVLQWTIDNFLPTGGGGSVVTQAVDLVNLITNNVFWRNIGSSSNPIGATSLRIAPGNHAALAQTASLYGPDIFFKKNNTSATDQITFPTFVLGDTPLTGDVTPVDYLKYSCTGAGTSETFKYIQIPVCAKVQNLSNQPVVLTFWGRGNSGTTTVSLFWAQFFGDGTGASATVRTLIDTISLDASWEKQVITTSIPTVSTKVLGPCGNDGLFLQIQYPLDVTCNIDITKPCLYQGSLFPPEDFLTYDQIDAVINAPRTGHTVCGFDLTSPPGYLLMNDGTIGNASSNATTRRNVDTFPLFNLLWNSVSNTWAPLLDSSGTPIARGSSAVEDFEDNNQLTLTRVLGRAISSAGTGSGLTARALGQFLGEENHTLTISEMPSHNHPGSTVDGTIGVSGGPPFSAALGSANPAAATIPNVNVASQGGGVGHNTMQPTSFMNVFIKL